jgi:hypothetical protein
MRLELLRDSRVYVDLQATGLLRAVGHDPTLTAVPEPTTLDLGGEVSIAFPVRDIAAPGDMSASDQDKMLEHLRGPEVLDAARFPVVTLKARFDGSVADGGSLQGTLGVRGSPRPLRLRLSATRGDDLLVAGATWQGTLTDLGIKPFKALLGALKLKDWVRIRVDARLRALD